MTSPACPLLVDDLCSVYHDRPLLCRAYGFPVDAYAVQSDSTIVFRSLCVLYEGMQLFDYIRAKDLKGRLIELSRRLGGGRDWGRFTSPEAILSRVTRQD
jgi:Fe-S-cluster containining protein